MTDFTIDDLYQLTDTIRNSIQDNKDYCQRDEEYEEAQERLNALLVKVEGYINQANAKKAA